MSSPLPSSFPLRRLYSAALHHLRHHCSLPPPTLPSKRRTWSPREDARLAAAVRSVHQAEAEPGVAVADDRRPAAFWRRVAEQVGAGASRESCFNRARALALLESLGRRRAAPRRFSPAEEKTVTEALQARPGDYGGVAQRLGRPRKAVKQVWEERLRPGIKRAAWTDEDDQILREVVLEKGNDWTAASEALPGRTRSRCRDRWSTISKKSGQWSDEEDEVLLKAWQKLKKARGFRGFTFGDLASSVEGRSASQCRQRLGRLVPPVS